MWSAVNKEEKRIKDIIGDARKRAQRRRAYTDSKLGDPLQLLRCSGAAVKLVTNAESYAFHEDPNNLMPWTVDPSVRIDRFDGRALLDFLPFSSVNGSKQQEFDDGTLDDELGFERWHELANRSRLGVSEEQCLADNEEEWNDLVARHKALIGVSAEKKTSKIGPGAAIGFDYGTNDTTAASNIEKEHELPPMEEENILEHLARLTDKDLNELNVLGQRFGIRNYSRLLRIAKRDEDARIRQLKVTAMNLERAMVGKKPLKAADLTDEMEDTRRSNRRSRRHGRRRNRGSESPPLAFRSTRRSSPRYDAYYRSGDESTGRSGSESPSEKDSLDFLVGISTADPGEQKHDKGISGAHRYGSFDGSRQEETSESESDASDTPKSSLSVSHSGTKISRTAMTFPSKQPVTLQATKQLSMLEKLKLTMRQGLDQTVRSEEIKKQVKEREIEIQKNRRNEELYGLSLTMKSSSTNTNTSTVNSTLVSPTIKETSTVVSSNIKESVNATPNESDRGRSTVKDEGRSRSRSLSKSGRDRKRSRSRSRSNSRDRSRSGRSRGRDGRNAEYRRDQKYRRSRSRTRARSRARSDSRDRGSKRDYHSRDDAGANKRRLSTRSSHSTSSRRSSYRSRSRSRSRTRSRSRSRSRSPSSRHKSYHRYNDYHSGHRSDHRRPGAIASGSSGR